MDKRAKYNKDSKIIGDKSEYLLNEYFKTLNVKYVWENEYKESFKKYDFAFYNGDKITYIVECENKSNEYKKYYVRDGLDFISSKVETLFNFPYDSYYFLVIREEMIAYYQSISFIMKYGTRFFKSNKRKNSEAFYRVPFRKCKELKI